jgi:hypothetical protein
MGSGQGLFSSHYLKIVSNLMTTSNAFDGADPCTSGFMHTSAIREGESCVHDMLGLFTASP